MTLDRLPDTHAETVIRYRLHCRHLGVEPVLAPTMYPRKAATTPNQTALWHADNLQTSGAEAVPALHEWLDEQEVAHLGAEQGGYRGFHEEAVLSMVRPAQALSGILEGRIYRWLSVHASYAALCDPGDGISRVPGPRLGDPYGAGVEGAARDAIRFPVVNRELRVLASDAAVALASSLCRKLRDNVEISPRLLPRLLSRLVVEVYERGRRAYVEEFVKMAGGGAWSITSDAAGRQESVTWRLVTGSDDFRRDAKVWGRRSKKAPAPAPAAWWAMGRLVEAWELGPTGAQRVDPSQPPAPPVEPPPPPRRPRRPKPPKPSEPAEDTIAGDHEWEHLEGGRPKQCRWCYHGRDKHPMPGRVPRRLPDDMSKRPAR